MNWGEKEEDDVHLRWRNYEDLVARIGWTAIATTHFLSRAMLVAETAYLKLCDETPHNFNKGELPVWCTQYIRDNLFEVARVVLRSYAADCYSKNVPITVFCVEEGSFKSIKSDTIYSFVCLKVKIDK